MLSIAKILEPPCSPIFFMGILERKYTNNFVCFVAFFAVLSCAKNVLAVLYLCLVSRCLRYLPEDRIVIVGHSIWFKRMFNIIYSEKENKGKISYVAYRILFCDCISKLSKNDCDIHTVSWDQMGTWGGASPSYRAYMGDVRFRKKLRVCMIESFHPRKTARFFPLWEGGFSRVVM